MPGATADNGQRGFPMSWQQAVLSRTAETSEAGVLTQESKPQVPFFIVDNSHLTILLFRTKYHILSGKVTERVPLRKPKPTKEKKSPPSLPHIACVNEAMESASLSVFSHLRPSSSLVGSCDGPQLVPYPPEAVEHSLQRFLRELKLYVASRRYCVNAAGLVEDF